MKKETDNNVFIRVALILFVIAFSLASNDDYKTAQRVKVVYQTK